MGIINITTEFAGQVGVKPRHVRIVTTDAYADVITAGYLNSLTLMGNVIYPTDTIDIAYSDGHTIFTPSISGGVITLSPMLNSNLVPSDPALDFIVTSDGGVTIGNLASFVDVDGSIGDSAIATTAVQLKANIKAARTANIGGAGAGPISVAVTGLTAASIVTGSIQASTNAVTIQKFTATATGFDILFSGDPGATCTVNYVAFIAAQ